MFTFKQFQAQPLSRWRYSFGNETCAMDLLSLMVYGYKTDRPECVQPKLRNFVIQLNDCLQDDQRQELKPFIPRMINTAYDDKEVLHKRTNMINKAQIMHCSEPKDVQKNWDKIKQELDKILSLGESTRECFAFAEE